MWRSVVDADARPSEFGPYSRDCPQSVRRRTQAHRRRAC